MGVNRVRALSRLHPPAPAGTRDVVISAAHESAGDFATVRSLTLHGDIGAFAVPPGTYDRLIADGQGRFVLGVAGATEPAVYNVQALLLNGTGELEIVGPVVLTLANGFTLNAAAGAAAHPDWLTLRLYTGGVTLNGRARLYATVLAPSGEVAIVGGAALQGRIEAERLSVQSQGVLQQSAP